MIDWIKSKTNKYRKDYGKYNFYLKSEPQFIDSSTTITLTAYSNIFKNAIVPCVYRWSVIKNGLKLERPDFRGSSFRCQPADLGVIIEAQVISTDSEYNGTAIVHLGPVRLDIKSRKHIEVALNKGEAVVSAHLVQQYEERECQFRLSESMVKISHVYSQAILAFDIGIQEPIIQCTSKDKNNIIIHFGDRDLNPLKDFKQKLFNSHCKRPRTSLRSTNYVQGQISGNWLGVKFTNHQTRDNFIFVWKGLIAKRQLMSSMVVQRLQNVDLTKNDNLDYMMEIEGLKGHLNKMDLALKKANEEKNLQFQQIYRLKEQIHSVVMAYTEALGQNHSNSLNITHNSSFKSQKRIQRSPNYFKKLQNEKNHLNSRINALTNEIDAIRFQPKIINSVKISTEPMSVKSPFSKKKSQDDTLNFISLLEDLSSSRVSDISEIGYIREDQTLKIKLQNVERKNQELQNKLQMSFDKIGILQKKLQMNTSEYHGKTHNIGRQMIQSNNNTSFHNVSVNFSLMNSPQNQSFTSVKTEKKEPIFMEQQDKELLALVMKRSNQITALKQQIQILQKCNNNLHSELQSIKSIQIPKYQMVIKSLRQKVDMHRQNSDVLNGPQQICSQMAIFNKEQVQMLKKHNQFLTNQNKKLSKACEKYMNEARQCMNLRMEIVKLREKINSHKLL